MLAVSSPRPPQAPPDCYRPELSRRPCPDASIFWIECRSALSRSGFGPALAVDAIDAHAEPAQALAVEVEAQARQAGGARYVGLGRQGPGLLEGPRHDDVGELL